MPSFTSLAKLRLFDHFPGDRAVRGPRQVRPWSEALFHKSSGAIHVKDLRCLRQRPAIRQQCLARAQHHQAPLECESASGEGQSAGSGRQQQKDARMHQLPALGQGNQSVIGKAAVSFGCFVAEGRVSPLRWRAEVATAKASPKRRLFHAHTAGRVLLRPEFPRSERPPKLRLGDLRAASLKPKRAEKTTLANSAAVRAHERQDGQHSFVPCTMRLSDLPAATVWTNQLWHIGSAVIKFVAEPR